MHMVINVITFVNSFKRTSYRLDEGGGGGDISASMTEWAEQAAEECMDKGLIPHPGQYLFHCNAILNVPLQIME